MSLWISALLALAPQASDASGELPDGAALLDRFQAQAGPAERMAGIRNVVQHGRAAWEGLEGQGIVTETYAGLRRARITTEFGAFGTFEQGTEGEYVWERTPLGPVLRLGWDASQYLREYGLVQHVPWRELYRRAQTSGSEEIDGRRCWVVQLAPRPLVELEGDDERRVPPPDVLHLDAETLLPRRLEARSVGMFDEPVTRVIDYDRWRAVDGVQYAFAISLAVSGFRLEVEYQSIEHNVELAEGFFDPGDEIRDALQKERSGERQRADDAIVVEDLEARHIASIRVTCKHAEMQRTLSVLLPEAFEHVASVGVGMAGPPLVRYHEWGDPIDLEAAIPIVAPIEAAGRVKPEVLPAGKAVIAWHVGPYEELGVTHERIQAFLKAEGLEQRGAAWEEYWTDPGMEPDSSKWRTRVVWPVRARQ